MASDRDTLPEEEKKEKLRQIEAGREFLTESVYGDLRAEDYWKRFLQTGSVSDYLKYTANCTNVSFRDE